MAIFLLLFALMAGSCKSQSSKEQKDMDELAKNGVMREALITKQDSLDKSVFYYDFVVNEKEYSGHFTTKNAQKFKVGTMIEVVYLQSNPRVNRRINW